MWQVKRLPHGTLYLSIGTQDLHAAVSVRKSWLLESLLHIPIASPRVGNDHSTVLAALTELLPALRSVKEASRSGLPLPAIRQLRVLVADRWLMQAGIPWSDACQDADGERRFAHDQMTAAGYTLALTDTIRVDDAPFGQRRMGVAYPAGLLSALDDLAAELGTTLTSVLPMSVAAWSCTDRTAHGAPRALAIVDAGMLTLALGTANVTEVLMRPHSTLGEESENTAQALSALWQRMRLRMPYLMAVERLHVLILEPSNAHIVASTRELACVALKPPFNDTMPAPLLLAQRVGSRRLALDGIDVKTAMAGWQWLSLFILIGTGVILLAQAGWAAWHVDALTKANASSFVSSAKRSNLLPRRRDDETKINAVNTAIRELNLPFPALSRAMQPPRDIQIGLLRVDIPSIGAAEQLRRLSIEAAARTEVDMTRYVQFVSEQKPFVSAILTRHSVDEASPEYRYRFAVEATWQE